MSKVRVAGFSISLDGFGAGPDQSLEAPLGLRGQEVHEWMFPTRFFKQMIGQEGGETGVDAGFAERAMHGFGAFIMGRNMFGPVRGPWPAGGEWQGWWGDDPPYHTPVYVLTHHPREPLVMQGGNVFHFVTGGPEAALDLARAAAGVLDIKIAGGVSTVRQYLRLGVVDELHLAVSPVLLGRGEALFEGLDLSALGYAVADRVEGERATHIVLRKG